MKKMIILIVFLFLAVSNLASNCVAQINDGSQNYPSEYFDKNGNIPKEYGRLVHMDWKDTIITLWFEANDGTIRVLDIAAWDDKTHYVSKAPNAC